MRYIKKQLPHGGSETNSDRDLGSKRFITATQLRARYGGRSVMWLHRMVRNRAGFPQPITIGRHRLWSVEALEAFERSLAAASSK